MYSPSLQQLLIQAHIEELHRQVSSRRWIAAMRGRAIRHGHAAPLSAYLKRAIERRDGRAASGAAATSSQS